MSCDDRPNLHIPTLVLPDFKELPDYDNPRHCSGLLHNQGGQDILVSGCPRCGRQFGLNNEGRHLCQCGAWLHIHAESPEALARIKKPRLPTRPGEIVTQ